MHFPISTQSWSSRSIQHLFVFFQCSYQLTLMDSTLPICAVCWGRIQHFSNQHKRSLHVHLYLGSASVFQQSVKIRVVIDFVPCISMLRCWWSPSCLKTTHKEKIIKSHYYLCCWCLLSSTSQQLLYFEAKFLVATDYKADKQTLVRLK